MRQTVYRVLVASKPSHLSENRGDLWDSGKIVSGEYQLITYQGTNEFRIMLGKGFYNTEGDRRVHGVNSKGVLMTILEAHLAYAYGSREVVVTDDSWDSAAGPILHSAIVAGSDYDARGAEPTEWSKATITNAAGTLRAVESPPMQMFETLSPIKRADEPESGIFVYDFGQNLSAIPFIRARGKIGQTVRLTPAEQRHDQTGKRNNGTGLVNQAGVGRPNYYEYTLSAEGQDTRHPQFTYGGIHESLHARAHPTMVSHGPGGNSAGAGFHRISQHHHQAGL